MEQSDVSIIKGLLYLIWASVYTGPDWASTVLAVIGILYIVASIAQSKKDKK